MGSGENPFKVGVSLPALQIVEAHCGVMFSRDCMGFSRLCNTMELPHTGRNFCHKKGNEEDSGCRLG